MTIDHSSGRVLSNGNLLEATFIIVLFPDKRKRMKYRIEYTGAMITRPDGQKIWRANSWYDYIEPLKP